MAAVAEDEGLDSKMETWLSDPTESSGLYDLARNREEPVGSCSIIGLADESVDDGTCAEWSVCSSCEDIIGSCLADESIVAVPALLISVSVLGVIELPVSPNLISSAVELVSWRWTEVYLSQ